MKVYNATLIQLFCHFFMRIVIATGIYPPEIGGTATYAFELSRALRARGHFVTALAYGEGGDEVIGVSRSGNFFTRWRRYASALHKHASDADIVLALSSVSTGIPLMMAKLKKPKKILRLGGDFFWERYTDGGGRMSLQEWYASRFGFWRVVNSFLMPRILQSFDALVYSTAMQQAVHGSFSSHSTPSFVLENAVPSGSPELHTLHQPMRLLCVSRFVGFKNLESLIEAMSEIPQARLTIIGDGPLRDRLKELSTSLHLDDRIDWKGVLSSPSSLFAEHDLLIIPSVTEISPNTALEARAAGLPVLLSEETGLSATLRSGMEVHPLRTSQDIARAILDIQQRFDSVARSAAAPPTPRTWSVVADEWISFLSSLR